MTLLVLEKIWVKVVKISQVKVDIVAVKTSQDKEINRGKAVKASRVTSQVMTKMIDQVTSQDKEIIKVDKPIQINLLILHNKVVTQEDKILNLANLLRAISRQVQVRKDHNNILINHLDSKVGKVAMMDNRNHLHNLVDRQDKRINLDKERLTIHKVCLLRNNITMNQRA